MRKLAEILNSDNKQNVAITCYDLGEFCRFYPFGKVVLEQLNANQEIMKQARYDNQRKCFVVFVKNYAPFWYIVKEDQRYIYVFMYLYIGIINKIIYVQVIIMQRKRIYYELKIIYKYEEQERTFYKRQMRENLHQRIILLNNEQNDAEQKILQMKQQ